MIDDVQTNTRNTGRNSIQSVLTIFDYEPILQTSIPPNTTLDPEGCNNVDAAMYGARSTTFDNDTQKPPVDKNIDMNEADCEDEHSPSAHVRSEQLLKPWRSIPVPEGINDPPICPARSFQDEFPFQILPYVCEYLSSQEVRTLRLVSRTTAAVLLPLIIRSTTIQFGSRLFGATNGTQWDEKSDQPDASSLLRNYGEDINRFGISFDFDPVGLGHAQRKEIEEEVGAWFGTYCWPKQTYPRFAQLKKLEDLLDSNRPLLKNTMQYLTDVSELAISIDSGHGWLAGPDISDMALIRDGRNDELLVFGKAFAAPDRRHDFALQQYFMWSQLNSLNAFAILLANCGKDCDTTRRYRQFLRSFGVAEYDDYKDHLRQPNVRSGTHTGGEPDAVATAAAPAITQQAQQNADLDQVPQPNAILANLRAAAAASTHAINAEINGQIHPSVQDPCDSATHLNITNEDDLKAIVLRQKATLHASGPRLRLPFLTSGSQVSLDSIAPRYRPRGAAVSVSKARDGSDDGQPIVPQWPLIFSGFNLAAEIGGNHTLLQDQAGKLSAYQFMPGVLTEAQAQWLMETLWAQRAFLSAWIHSIITNGAAFKRVHTINIAKMSSGLIPSLAQKDFWSALPSMKKLILKIIPDWRQEHVPGDKNFESNMSLPPVEAATKLAGLLQDYVAKIERLAVLRVGYVGGGEYQTGLFGRNRHILPAPVTCNPKAWIYDSDPDDSSMIVFSHIRDLTFENCWFHPRMLKRFMRKSRDTSLHHLTLDSVSLTGVHLSNPSAPIANIGSSLRCEFTAGDWLYENVPEAACWVDVLDAATPGKTMLDRKYDAGMFDTELNPRPIPRFRGNIKSITLKSCGYVKISGVSRERFNQDGVIKHAHQYGATDEGLEQRRRSHFLPLEAQVGSPHESPTTRPRDRPYRDVYNARANRETRQTTFVKLAPPCIMMSERSNKGSGVEYFGLGRLTQCVHPIEKRILEQAWGVTFGWGDDMERWAAVEDGWFEGGTGRFSGVIR